MVILKIATKNRNDFVNITSLVQKVVSEKKWSNGILYIYVPHTTAGITINECADLDVARDIINQLDKRIPWRDGYYHGEGNSAAHIKSSLIGSSTFVFIENNRINLGTWQGIFFTEFDGPRNRKIWIKFISS